MGTPESLRFDAEEEARFAWLEAQYLEDVDGIPDPLPFEEWNRLRLSRTNSSTMPALPAIDEDDQIPF